jgi:hypothetical protein
MLKKIEICEYVHCDEIAEFLDDSDNRVCSDCMEREIREGANSEDFESLESYYKAINKIS